MARPSQNLDRALLEAGFAELERGGVRGLSVRAVCARAGVNVRMLNYHFGSKDEFVRQLLNKTYQYFFNELSAGVRQNGAPLDRLACALRLIARFTVENRAIVRNLWMDINAGVPLVLEVTRSHGLRHIRLLYDLLAEAWEAGDLRRDIPVRQIFLAVIPGVFAPLMWRERVLPFQSGYKLRYFSRNRRNIFPRSGGDASAKFHVPSGRISRSAGGRRLSFLGSRPAGSVARNVPPPFLQRPAAARAKQGAAPSLMKRKPSVRPQSTGALLRRSRARVRPARPPAIMPRMNARAMLSTMPNNAANTPREPPIKMPRTIKGFIVIPNGRSTERMLKNTTPFSQV